MNHIRRTDIEQLSSLGLEFTAPWQVVEHFENTLADFFGAPYAVAVDCCTHGLELCLRLWLNTDQILQIPKHTYLSVPMTCDKLHRRYQLVDTKWHGMYQLSPLPIIDAATVFRRNCYIPGTYMVISFQYKKHLPIGRGGVILTDDHEYAQRLRRMSYDGRTRGMVHADDNVQEIGFHYYMTPEDAARGIRLFEQVKHIKGRDWSWQDYGDLTSKDYFKNKSNDQSR